MWDVHSIISTITIGVLRSVSPNLKIYIKKIRIKPNIASLWKSAVLGSEGLSEVV